MVIDFAVLFKRKQGIFPWREGKNLRAAYCVQPVTAQCRGGSRKKEF